MSADAGLRKSLAFILAAESFASVDYIDLVSARAASMLAACRCAIVDEVAPGDSGDLTVLPTMPMIVLCDRAAPARQKGRVRFVTKPVLGPKLIVLLRRLLDDTRAASPK